MDRQNRKNPGKQRSKLNPKRVFTNRQIRQLGIRISTGPVLACFVARILIRLKYQKRLRLDDAFLILAIVCLCAGTALFKWAFPPVIWSPVPPSGNALTQDVMKNIKDQKRTIRIASSWFLVVVWTTVFAVKGCFLAFSRPLVWHISRTANRYYWFCVWFCLLSWVYAIVEPFAIGSYFFAPSGKC